MSSVLRVSFEKSISSGPLVCIRYAGRTRKIENRIAAGMEWHTLICCGQEAARPESCSATGSARSGLDHNKARQILRLASNPICDPCSKARPAEPYRAGIDEAF